MPWLHLLQFILMIAYYNQKTASHYIFHSTLNGSFITKKVDNKKQSTESSSLHVSSSNKDVNSKGASAGAIALAVCLELIVLAVSFVAACQLACNGCRSFGSCSRITGPVWDYSAYKAYYKMLQEKVILKAFTRLILKFINSLKA